MADIPHFELVECTASDALVLPGILFSAPSSKKVLLTLHGTGGTHILRHPSIHTLFATELAASGISYCAFNNRGAGYISKFNVRTDDPENDRYIGGMAYERIRECVADLDGMITFLEDRGYEEIYLLGHSTGANKVCLYHYYKPDNKVAKSVLVAGGDDTGLTLTALGEGTFHRLLDEAKLAVREGKGRELIGEYLSQFPFSYQAYLDMNDPDGDYNIFPFYEVLQNKRLGTKELFREYRAVKTPTLVLYGEQDEYCYGNVAGCVAALQKATLPEQKVKFTTISGANHNFEGKEQEYVTAVREFLG